MHSYACDDAHEVGAGLMFVALLVVAGYVTLTAVCLGTLMSLARRMQRRAARVVEERTPDRRYAGA
jgi:hypothetical protein